MRRALVVLLIATVCSLLLAPATAQAGKLKVDPKEQAEGNEVKISGKTGCKKSAGVHIRSLPRKGNRAIKPGKVKVKRDGTFSTTRTVRKSAVKNKSLIFKIVSHCRSPKGRRSGVARLKVLPFNGLPVLPQLLVGLGLIASGAALLRGDRGGGASGRRRKLSKKPLPVSAEKMIARRAPKAD